MSYVAVPTSVREYMHQRSVRTAVEHLLDSGTEQLPEGLDDWSEVRAYHRAYLSACQVRGEHALLLMDLWDAIWGEGVKETAAGWKPMSPEEHVEYGGDSIPSPDDLWTNTHAFCRWFVSKSGKRHLNVGVDYWSDVGIRIYFLSEQGDHGTRLSDDLALPDPWTPEPDDYGFRQTSAEFLVPEDRDAVDVAPLKVAAVAALRSEA